MCSPVSCLFPLSGQPHETATSAVSRTMRFGSTAKVLANCKLEYYRISECPGTVTPGILLLPWDPCGYRRDVVSHWQTLPAAGTASS